MMRNSDVAGDECQDNRDEIDREVYDDSVDNDNVDDCDGADDC